MLVLPNINNQKQKKLMQYEPEKLSIKAWAEADQPREKLLLKGKHALSDAELIAIIIGSGNTTDSAIELSKKILNSVSNNLSELAKLTVKDLTKFKGIGEAKAISIVAALEIGRRRRESEGMQREKISNSRDIVEIFQPLLGDLPHEEFWILLLNRSNKVISKHNTSVGGVAGTVADAKIIFKLAIENLASSIILCHNHPSGNNKPSDADLKLTKQLKDTGRLLEIPVLDHIIITENAYYSFADEGIL
jgi:DNA repair protein RadC